MSCRICNRMQIIFCVIHIRAGAFHTDAPGFGCGTGEGRKPPPVVSGGSRGSGCRCSSYEGPSPGAATLPWPRFTDIQLQCQKNVGFLEKSMRTELEDTREAGGPSGVWSARVPSHGPLASREAREHASGGKAVFDGAESRRAGCGARRAVEGAAAGKCRRPCVSVYAVFLQRKRCGRVKARSN